MAKREVIYVDDIADACIYFMNKKIKENMVNVGTGKDFTIKKYAELMLKLIISERKIKIVYDRSKPNGTPRKVLDISLAKKYGWNAKSNFKISILTTYNSFRKKKFQLK